MTAERWSFSKNPPDFPSEKFRDFQEGSRRKMSSRVLITGVILGSLAFFFLLPPFGVRAQTAPSSPDNRTAENEPVASKSLTEVNKELTNPISSIWSLTFQENNYWVNMPTGHDDRMQVSTLFQPVLPIALTDNWNLITRPVIPVLNSNPYINTSGRIHRVTGFGDTIFLTMLSPTDHLVGNWLFAVGPTFIFPTATNSRLGQNKWQMGPAGVFGYLGEKFIAGVFPQQWWSTGDPALIPPANSTCSISRPIFSPMVGVLERRPTCW
jgi:hypothetical protein